PRALVEESEDGHAYRMLAYSTTIAGLGGVPASVIPSPHPSMRVLDLCRPLAGQLLTFPTGELRDYRLPSLKGASGGGCWKSGVRPEPSAFDVHAIRLSGIHIGATKNPADTHIGPCLFMREVLVGHHLRLIADTVPEVRERAFDYWPQLRDDTWSQPPT